MFAGKTVRIYYITNNTILDVFSRSILDYYLKESSGTKFGKSKEKQTACSDHFAHY